MRAVSNGTNLGFRWAAAQRIFSQAQVDGFAFDVEVLWLARQLRLEVAEVQVEAVERPGSKVLSYGMSRWMRRSSTTDSPSTTVPPRR